MAYVTAAEFRGWLGVSVADATEQALLDGAVSAAGGLVDDWCGQQFDQTSATARTFVPQDWCVLHLPPPSRISSTTSLVVKTDMGGDGTYETTLSATDYLLEPTAEYVSGVQRPWRTVRSLNGARFPVLPYGKATVQITALWGWAAVPAAVKQATFIVAADLWKAKDAAFGVAGFGEFGAVRVGSRINPQAQVLLAPFVENARLA
jgi:hypothetical protein